MTDRLSTYPLTVSWSIGATLVAMLVSVVADELLPGYALFVLGVTVALTWRRGEAPIFAFLLANQWVAVTIGYWYEKAYGVFPSAYRPGDVETTMGWALTGLLLLAVGIRLTTSLADWIWRRRHPGEPVETLQVRNLKALFLLVIGAYAVDYVSVIDPKAFPGFDVIFERLLDIRQVLSIVLWYEVLRRRSGYFYLWTSLAWVFLPRLGTYYSEFKSPFIILAIVLASTWRPWERHWWRRGIVTAVRGAPAIALLVFLVLIWQAGVRKETRLAHDTGAISQDPIERIEQFISSARDATPTVLQDTRDVVEGLVERLSYITFFSLTIDHVPSREPFAEGELLNIAVVNSSVPRFLFPDKPPLPSDSYYTRRFAGVSVAETGTSISIGYMAEFYADWGFRGMLLSVFLYGCWMGVGGAVIRRFARPSIFVNAVLIMVFLRVAEFETQFVKGLAALNVSIIVNLVVLALVRPWVVRIIGVAPAPPADPLAAGQSRIDAQAPAVHSA